MRHNMKQARMPKPKTKPATSPTPASLGGSICKSVSMPPAMWASVEQRIAQEPDLDFSKLIRRLLRADLAVQFVTRAKP